MEPMELTPPERQLIEILREQQQETDDTFRLVVEHSEGAWEIELSGMVRIHRGPDRGKMKQNAARGVGTTFDDAWDDMAPSWA